MDRAEGLDGVAGRTMPPVDGNFPLPMVEVAAHDDILLVPRYQLPGGKAEGQTLPGDLLIVRLVIGG